MLRNAPEAAASTPASLTTAAPRPARRLLTLADLAPGDTARVVRVSLADPGCRRRFAELGLGEGMALTVTAAGDTMILALGSGRMAVAQRCAREISVLRTTPAPRY